MDGELARVFVRLAVDDTGLAGELHSSVDDASRGLTATATLKADDGPAKRATDDMKARIVGLMALANRIKLGVDDKAALAVLTSFQAKLIRLNDTKVDPEVNPAGFLDAEAKLHAIEHSLDKIDGRTATAHVEVKDRGGLFSRLFGGGGGGGFLGGLFGLGGSAAGSAGSAAGGASQAAGPSGTAALYGAGGLAAAALAPAAIPTVLGLGLGGVGAFLSAGKQIGKIFSDSFAQIKRDVAPLRPLFVSVFSFLPGLAKSIGPGLRDVFAESVPYLRTFVGLLKPAAQILLPAFSRVLREFQPFLPQISRGLLAIVQGLAGMLNAIGPRGMQNSAKIFVGLCRLMGFSLTVLGKLINATAVFLVWLGNKIIQRVNDYRRTFDDFRHRTAVIFDGLRHDIAHYWDLIYSNTIGTVIRFVTAIHAKVANFRHTIATDFDGIRHDVASAWDAMWSHIQNAASSGWQWVVTHVWNPVKNLVTKTLPGWFTTAVTLVGRGWAKIGGAVRGPVNWVITHVLDGLIGAFDWVTSHIGLGKPIPKIPQLAAGGRLPGYGGGDRHPAMLEAGETVVSKESSRLPFMRAAFMAAGVPGYQAGGIAPRPGGPQALHTGIPQSHISGNPLAGLIKGAYTIGRITAAIATGNTTALTNALSALFPHGVGGAGGELGKILVAAPARLLSDGVHWLISHLKSAVGIGQPSGHGAISGGVQRWAGLVRQVLAMLHQPAGDIGTVLAQMTTESGGNPFAINLSDSNAAAGDPSRGLMQTIMSTFLAYAGPFRGRGIYDPLANIYAGVNYAIHRYGAAWTSVLGHGHGYGLGGLVGLDGSPVRVFDSGGILEPGMNRVWNGTGAREPLVPAGRGGPMVEFSGPVYMTDRTDAELVAQRLNASIVTSSFG